MNARFSHISNRGTRSFRKNTSAFVSLILFSALFFVSLMSNLICNDRPLVVVRGCEVFFPVLKNYTEKSFGLDLEVEPDYKGAYFSSMMKGSSSQVYILWPPIRYSYLSVGVPGRGEVFPSPPSREHILGTDDQGRDVFARLLYGMRTSILFGLALAFAGCFIGVCIGAIQGYFGGIIDISVQRFSEVWSGLPVLFITMIVSSFVRATAVLLFFIILAFKWGRVADAVRAEFLRSRNYSYVKAAEALGAGHISIMMSHVLPNSMVSVISYFPFLMSSSISYLTALDFLGFGLPAGAASLGELARQAKNNLHAPWVGAAAFFGLASILILINFIGEGVRDALNHKS
ncbi:ABC transporter permease [Candidatus Hydrogenosomobacter endosymbioticus]|uniref:ABC transporter permease n=1 Tax=Candidatus Hydrogenosomobacter endosymbioticus TaxID=2558174 RepID=A0ABM7VAB1_9PROT|nr:ABC transporter permease [Candidatus Hydrogenosomobacter endosymbioticus]BDB96470.1 ABC transporter permease [Candidatus Hydrogenosomobacter endosymbioticus]